MKYEIKIQWKSMVCVLQVLPIHFISIVKMLIGWYDDALKMLLNFITMSLKFYILLP